MPLRTTNQALRYFLQCSKAAPLTVEVDQKYDCRLGSEWQVGALGSGQSLSMLTQSQAHTTLVLVSKPATGKSQHSNQGHPSLSAPVLAPRQQLRSSLLAVSSTLLAAGKYRDPSELSVTVSAHEACWLACCSLQTKTAEALPDAHELTGYSTADAEVVERLTGLYLLPHRNPWQLWRS